MINFQAPMFFDIRKTRAVGAVYDRALFLESTKYAVIDRAYSPRFILWNRERNE